MYGKMIDKERTFSETSVFGSYTNLISMLIYKLLVILFLNNNFWSHCIVSICSCIDVKIASIRTTSCLVYKKFLRAFTTETLSSELIIFTDDIDLNAMLSDLTDWEHNLTSGHGKCWWLRFVRKVECSVHKRNERYSIAKQNSFSDSGGGKFE